MNSKYIDRYILRYGVGTFFGCIILVALFKIDGLLPSALQKFPIMKEWYFLIGAGFAFSYIASAPFLLFHIGRVLDFRIPRARTFPCLVSCDRRLRCKWFCKCMIFLHRFILVLPVIFLVVLLLCLCHCVALSFGECFEKYWKCSAIFGIWLVYTIPYIALAICLLCKKPEIVKGYRTLARRRTERDLYCRQGETSQRVVEPNDLPNTEDRRSEVKEYVESYRDLREHGNAYLIVIYEAFLALVFVCICKTISANAETAFYVLMLIVTLWSAPAVVAFFIGHHLEADWVSGGSQ